MIDTRFLIFAFGSVCAMPACSDDDPGAGHGGSGGKAGSSDLGGAGGVAGARALGGSGAAGTGVNVDPGSAGGLSGSSGAGAGDAGAPGSSGGATGQNACKFPAAARITNASVPAGYCAYTWASGLTAPRGIVVDGNGDVLVIERTSSLITLLYDDDANGVSDSSERVELARERGINHGIALSGGYLYASSATTVFRWRYAGDRRPLGSPEVVVTGIPGGGHSTRTLLFDAEGRLYVSIGSGRNVDPNSSRARIIRYPRSALGTPSTFGQGELFADGLRNEVGLTLDTQGRVWGVENERDELARTDLGGDIHEDNPAEELNLFLEANTGRFYGYPFCWSEGNLPRFGLGSGTQWADPTFAGDGTHTDSWCRDTNNVLPPILTLQAHSAPLDLKFYSGSSFPEEVIGDALITFHGSWNRSVATGYKVVRVPFGADGMPSEATPIPLFESANSGDSDQQWLYRPVGLGIGSLGQVLVTSDSNGVIVAIGYADD